SSRRRHTRSKRDWSSDVCSSDLLQCLMQLRQRDAVDHVDRDNDVAQRFGHLTAVCVTNHRVQVDHVEGKLFTQQQTQHHHTSDPEKDYILTGFEQGARKEGLHFWRLIRPTKECKWKEARAEPGVKHVLVLSQLDLVLGNLQYAKKLLVS